MERQKAVFSFWEKSIYEENIDFAIIGSGLVGLSTAIHLSQWYPEKKIVIFEAASHPYGASSKNAGFACFGSAGEIVDDLQRMSEEEVIKLIKMRWDGLQLLLSLVNGSNIEYQACGGTEVFDQKDQKIFDSISNNLSEINRLVFEAIGTKGTFQIKNQNYGLDCLGSLIYNQSEGCLHPGKMMQALKKKAINSGVIFRWNNKINNYMESGSRVRFTATNGMQYLTDHFFICTNAFTRSLIPSIDLKPARNQVMMTQIIPGLKIDSCFHYDKGYVYFRNYNNRLLIGGARNLDLETESVENLGENEKILNFLKRFMKEKLFNGRSYDIDYKWSGIIAVGDKKSPIIKQLSDRVYIGVRMGGMGVALGSLIGKELAEMFKQQ